MNRLRRRAYRVALVCGLALLSFVPAWPQQPSPPQPPARVAPGWTPIAAGWDVYVKQGCGQCHAIRGSSNGREALDLARIRGGPGFYELGAAMWNHQPLRGAKMHQPGIERPPLTPLELSSLLAFIFTAQYNDEPGNEKAGEGLFTAKGCVQCHAVGGKVRTVGPALADLKRTDSPVQVAASMWSHGLRMAEAMRSKGIARPTFKRNEFVDVIAYVAANTTDRGETPRVLPGTPAEGEVLFRDKHCGSCHAIGGKGGTVGPELGRAHHVSVIQFAGLMWNHGPAMWARMKAQSLEAPRLSGQEMADLVAYLYSTHYFDPGAGNRVRGRQVVQSKGCLACHAVSGKGGALAGDLSSSTVVSSPSSLIAAMWNCSRAMEDKAQARGIQLPTFKGQELADLAAYLESSKQTPR